MWFSLGTPVSSTNKTDRNDITEILLKVAFKHRKPKPNLNLLQTIHGSNLSLFEITMFHVLKKKFYNIHYISPLQKGKAAASFKHHTAPITSIEWNPNDSSVFAASGSDNQITIWDLSVEKDTTTEGEPDVPPQLLFIHQGQTDIKELHWHRQMPGVIISTAHSGFNIFRTISV